MIYMQTLIVVLVILLIAIGFWANKVKPGKSVLGKYSKWLFIYATLPFYDTWRDQVEECDISKFVAYRKRLFVLYIMNFIVFMMFALIILNFDFFYEKM